MNAKKKLLQDFNKYWEVKNNTYWEQKKKVVPQILGIQKKSCCKVFRHVGQQKILLTWNKKIYIFCQRKIVEHIGEQKI